MNVLVIGSGGREHALSWKISQSEQLDDLYVMPGNPGTAQLGTNLDVDISNHKAVIQACREFEVDLVVVGPEQPLVAGLADELNEAGIAVFGPSRKAAQLEGSKQFAKEFMNKYHIPTADYRTFTMEEFDDVVAYTKERDQFPVVLKADGLAGGKGVFICESQQEVEQRLDEFQELDNLKSAAQTLVVEEFMEGEEASVFAISDGSTVKIITHAQDHKRIGDGDTGLNTGGMGAYTPAPVIDEGLLDRIEQEIVLPTITGMQLDDTPYIGFLYCGLMITESGPKVVEYNCRFGDPECQPIMPAIQSDLLQHMWAATQGKLADEEIMVDDLYRCCVMMASEGYPRAYEKEKPITGIEDVADDALVFHSGTKRLDDTLVTNGGRVLSVVSKGHTLQEAIDRTYEQIKHISFENAYYRTDIGHKGLAHLA
ncbi:MAG: phosphoribosylamine--glycine ligase [Bacteroidota bacterium]